MGTSLSDQALLPGTNSGLTGSRSRRCIWKYEITCAKEEDPDQPPKITFTEMTEEDLSCSDEIERHNGVGFAEIDVGASDIKRDQARSDWIGRVVGESAFAGHLNEGSNCLPDGIDLADDSFEDTPQLTTRELYVDQIIAERKGVEHFSACYIRRIHRSSDAAGIMHCEIDLRANVSSKVDHRVCDSIPKRTFHLLACCLHQL